MPVKLCVIDGKYPKKAGHPLWCKWHWLLKQPAEEQVRWADHRASRYDAGGVDRMPRVPAAQWPEGERWCAGCQSFVPLFYVRGPRCVACTSRDSHRGHVERTYDITGEEWQRLFEWQGGRCYICGQRPISRRLATDHDHRTNEVRGLLCADNERGCNHVLLGLLERSGVDPLAAARRLVSYLERPPLARLRAGEASDVPGGPTRAERLACSVLGTPLPGNDF